MARIVTIPTAGVSDAHGGLLFITAPSDRPQCRSVLATYTVSWHAVRTQR
jgi:hypothetical protein